MRLTVAILVASFFPSASTRAQETPADLAMKLGSGNYAEREQAAKKLDQLGRAALPVLEQMLGAADLETKRRAQGLMEKIEDRVLREELLMATPVRIRINDSPVEMALLHAERQMGLRLNVPTNKTRVTFDTGVVTYWHAWSKVRTACNVAESDSAKSVAKLKSLGAAETRYLLSSLDADDARPTFKMGTIHLSEPGETPSWSADDRGSVRVRLRWLALDQASDEKKDFAVFAVELRAEPRLEFASVPRVEITKIVDDQGRDRSAPARRLYPQDTAPAAARFLDGYTGEIQYSGLLHLKSIPWDGPPRTLKEVHGRVRMDLNVYPPWMELPRVLHGEGKRLRAHQAPALKVLKAAANDGRVNLCVQFNDLDRLVPLNLADAVVRVRPGVIALRGPIDFALERMALVDSLGRRHYLVNRGQARRTDGTGIEFDLTSDLPDGVALNDLSLVLSKAPRTMEVDMPFVVRDVVWMDRKPK